LPVNLLPYRQYIVRKQNEILLGMALQASQKFDINFGNRLHIFKRKEALLFSFEYNLLPNLISNFNHYMDMAL
jgi:hypothetical protein